MVLSLFLALTQLFNKGYAPLRTISASFEEQSFSLYYHTGTQS